MLVSEGRCVHLSAAVSNGKILCQAFAHQEFKENKLAKPELSHKTGIKSHIKLKGRLKLSLAGFIILMTVL